MDFRYIEALDVDALSGSKSPLVQPVQLIILAVLIAGQKPIFDQCQGRAWRYLGKGIFELLLFFV